MKKHASIFLVAFSLIFANAQEISLRTKQSAIFKDGCEYSDIVAGHETADGGTVMLRMDSTVKNPSGVNFFETYTADLQLIKRKEIVIKAGTILDFILDGERIIALFLRFDKNHNAIYTAAVADVKALEFTETTLLEISDPSYGGWDTKMMLSDDKKRFGLVAVARTKTEESFHAAVFDLSFQNLFSQQFKHARPELDRFLRYPLQITATADLKTLFILSKLDDFSIKKNKKETDKYRYELIRLDQSGSASSSFGTGSHFIPELRLVVKNDVPVCAGYYSDKENMFCKGVCYLTADPNSLNITTEKYHLFTEQFLADRYRNDKRKDEIEKGVKIRSLLSMPNGDIVLNMEDQYSKSSSVGFTEFFGDIIIARFDPSGNLRWARDINKGQGTLGGDEKLSFLSVNKGNDVYYFINTEKVKHCEDDRYHFGPIPGWNDCNLHVIRVDDKGVIGYRKVRDETPNELPLEINRAKSSGDGNSVYVQGRYLSKKNLLKINI